MSIYQITLLMVFIYAGEHLILEPEDKYKFDRKDSPFVYPGRKQTVTGDPLYEQWKEQTGGMASRHLTWVFHFFILMQIWNIICSRKIRDEGNVFSGVASNQYFVFVWLGIVILQFVITTFGRKYFRLHEAGLSMEQHLEAILVSGTIFIWDAILKCF